MSKVSECETCSDSSCSAQKQSPGESDQEYADRQLLNRRMCRIKHKIFVLSGKGGVGKSTVSVNLAAFLADEGKKVGLLDIDIHGPSVPRLLGLEDSVIEGGNDSLRPVTFAQNLKVISIGFMLKERTDAVIWRGPMKYSLIKQFLKDVEWGELDYLIVDSPPGTGDEPLSVCQLIGDADGALIVTTPQEIALLDVRKSITFCKQLNIRVLGVVENMSGFKCPKCGEISNIFGSDGAERMAAEMNVPFLGKIPLDPDVRASCDKGMPHVLSDEDNATVQIFRNLIRSVVKN